MLKSASTGLVARSSAPSIFATSVITILASVICAFSAQATVLNSTPHDVEISQAGGLPDIVGGTITATDFYLNTFTLYLGSVGGSPDNDLRAVVMETQDGLPTGTPLWVSDPVNAPGDLESYWFAPNIAINPGSQYFVGIDAGLMTSALGGDFTIGVTSNDPLSGGHVVWQQDGAPFWLESTASDIATYMTLTSSPVLTPEPSTALLVGIGLAIFGARKRSSSV